ncbi:MAG: hypothetical protein NLN64_05840 [Candidatus Thalassarchaeaceae archaeon]|nr:hypothetical protein [Candidatus Thalassarchaeaceae archaeon]
MVEGWILDIYQDSNSEGMIVWIKLDDGGVSKHIFHWSPIIHIAGNLDNISALETKLKGIEYEILFGKMKFSRQMRLKNHESDNTSEVLAISISRPSKIKHVADVIAAIGKWSNFEIYSVDPKPSQRFLHDMNTHPFGRVKISNNEIISLDNRTDSHWSPPPLKQAILKVNCKDRHGKRSPNGIVTGVTIIDMGLVGSNSKGNPIHIQLSPERNQDEFLYEVERAMHWINPDVLITNKGDSIDFPALINIASRQGRELQFSRNKRGTNIRRKAITTFSYGRILRSDAYHALEGRIHVDMGASFIGKEGGLEGLCELARVSGIPAQDLSRLSPGSAISAMQIKQSMEDRVLVPWKKNRPEDMKTGTQMLISDRGGLYLDPRPGVHKQVYELDFASLFPSIIATRNISPETMNCECCKIPEGKELRTGKLPLHPNMALEEIERRKRSNQDLQLLVPELGMHTCTKKYGFLGRVVAPIIERRKHLKSRRKSKGDVWDRRQNVLKWLLVTCFGYTGYKNARFGRIECHEAICAWSREMIIDAMHDAEEEGWDCLHAIVDSIWLVDLQNRSEKARNESISRLIDNIEAKSGVPIELEDVYEWIAFVPNRTTGVGALTKYFAYGANGWKIRGIELRQHSTCQWIKRLQKSILEELRIGPPKDAIIRSMKFFNEEISNLKKGKITLSELIIARRVRNKAGQHKVLNLTAAALLRELDLGQNTHPGRKIRFAVVGQGRRNPSNRIRMASEIKSGKKSILGQRGDISYYEALALRAASALLSPFGVSEEELASGGSVQTTLDMWSGTVKS